MAGTNTDTGTEFPGTGEATKDRYPGEPPDEASDDSGADIGYAVSVLIPIPTDVALHGPQKMVETMHRNQ
jgi:hypothetical protein